MTVQSKLDELKEKFGDYKITEDDYYESEAAADFSIDDMFLYFEDNLNAEKKEKIQECINSKLFLHDLIAIGELVLKTVPDVDSIVDRLDKDEITMEEAAKESAGKMLNFIDFIELFE